MSFKLPRQTSNILRNWNFITRKKKELMRFPPTSHLTQPNSSEKSLQLVDKLIAEGVNVNFATESGELALHSAINSNNLVLAEKLINLGADVNFMRCTYGAFQNCTPLHVAVEKRNVEIVKLLLRHNARVNIQNVTPVLTKAVRKGNFKLVDLLVNAGADLNPNNKFGKPLHMAIATNNSEMVNYLIYLGADVNGISRDKTTLQTAVKRGYKSIAKLLLEKGANVHDCQNGYTILCMAIEKDNFEIVELLIDAGANLNPVECCIVPLHWAILKKNTKLVEYLIKRGTDLNAIGTVEKSNLLKGNFSALQLAIMMDDITVVELLLKNGADMNLIINNEADSDDSLTVLHYAIEFNYEEEMKLLLKNDEVDVNVVTKIKRESLLHYATQHTPNEKLVEKLLEAGVDINYQNSFGKLAIDNTNSDQVKTSLELHILKRLAAELYVSKKNLNAVQEEKKYQLYLANCREEIKRMKTIAIYNTTHSLYDVLIKSVHDLSFILVNISGIRCISKKYLRTKLPIYGGIVYNRLKRAFHRKNYLEKAYDFVYVLLREKIPDLIIKEICRYLTTQDLKRCTY